MGKTVKIAMIGTGDISGIYLKNITETFHEIELAGVCDLVREKAEAAARKWNVPRIYKDMYEAFDDPEVDIVLNLTRPDEHYGVTKPALLAGKHVYSEKPLAATFELGQELVSIAKEKGLYLGGAPEGSSYVSSHQEGDTLTVELAGASPVDGPLLQAMAATLQAFSGAERLSLRCDGQELTAAGKTAQDFLKASLPITRTAEVDYRE